MDFERLKKQLKALKDEILPAMDKWLGEMDDGDYDQAWNDASDSFRLHGDATRWDAFAVKNRQPLGRLVDRKIDFAPRFFNEMSRANGEKVEGVFAYVQFRETFENPPAIKENVVFEREESGDWKAFSYALKDLTPQGGEVAP
jgi:hypothetical protein